jgi:hypothetical protein
MPKGFGNQSVIPCGTGRLSLTISAKPVGVGAVHRRLIRLVACFSRQTRNREGEKRFIVSADEKLTVFLELESQLSKETQSIPSVHSPRKLSGRTGETPNKARQIVVGAGKSALDYVIRRFDLPSARLNKQGWIFAETPLNAISRSNWSPESAQGRPLFKVKRIDSLCGIYSWVRFPAFYHLRF